MNTTSEAKVKTNKEIRKLTYSGIGLVLCMVLPFLTGQIPQIGMALAPMHIPVLLVGFIAGPFYAAAVGAIAPILRFLLFGMPAIMPMGLSMTFELAAYGLASGLLYRALPKKTVNIYVSLIAAMLLGRIVWGIASWILFSTLGMTFTIDIFIAGAFVNAIPGIIVHIVLIPLIVIALKKGNVLTGAEQHE